LLLSLFGCCAFVLGLESALERWAGGMVKKELDHVDMSAKLKSVGLDAFFGHDAWPPALAVNRFVRCGGAWCHACVRVQVRELATKVRTLVKAGEKKPFVNLELNKCVFFAWGSCTGGGGACVYFVCFLGFLPPNCAKHVALPSAGELKVSAFVACFACCAFAFRSGRQAWQGEQEQGVSLCVPRFAGGFG